MYLTLSQLLLIGQSAPKLEQVLVKVNKQVLLNRQHLKNHLLERKKVNQDPPETIKAINMIINMEKRDPKLENWYMIAKRFRNQLF